MTDCRFFRKNFLNYPSNVKIKIKKLSAHDLHWEIDEVAPPCHTMLINTLIIYFKTNKYVS